MVTRQVITIVGLASKSAYAACFSMKQPNATTCRGGKGASGTPRTRRGGLDKPQ
jgi:hypothetical protein